MNKIILIIFIFLLSCKEQKLDQDGDAFYFKHHNKTGVITLYYPDTTITFDSIYRIDDRIYSDIIHFKHKGVRYEIGAPYIIKFYE